VVVLRAIKDKANNPPTDPKIEGVEEGLTDEEYTFSLTAADPDDDNIKFIITWGDGAKVTTQYIPSDSSIQVNHIWTEPGEYTITVQTDDGKTLSGKTQVTITITNPPAYGEQINNEAKSGKETDDSSGAILFSAGILVITILSLLGYFALKKEIGTKK